VLSERVPVFRSFIFAIFSTHIFYFMAADSALYFFMSAG